MQLPPDKVSNDGHSSAPPAAVQGELAIVRERQRRAITGVPRTTWNRWEREGRVPLRRELGPGSVGWIRGELVAWVQSLPAREANHAA